MALSDRHAPRQSPKRALILQAGVSAMTTTHALAAEGLAAHATSLVGRGTSFANGGKFSQGTIGDRRADEASGSAMPGQMHD